MWMSRCILPSHLTTDVMKIAMTSTPQTTFSPSSSFGFSPSKDHSTAVCHFNGLISRVRLAVADAKELFESAVHDQSPSSVVNRNCEAWQAVLAFVRSSEETQSRHQAVLSLERDTVACEHLRRVHLCWYIVATLKALFDMIHQSTATCVNASIATGIDVAIHHICAERDFCAAPLDAILAKIAHIVVVQDNSSRTMSPACLPRSSAQVMTPLSSTTTTPSSPPSHTHPTSYLGAVLSPKGGGLPAVVASPPGNNGSRVGRRHAPSDDSPTQTASLPPWLLQRTSGAQSAR